MAADPTPPGPGGPIDPPPPTPPMGGPPAGQTSMGMDPKVASLLAYMFGWISGLIFFLMEKTNREVRFHAAQSLLMAGAFTILYYLIVFLPLGFLDWILLSILGIGGLVLWIVMMIKGYNLEHFKLPVIGDIAENMAGGSSTTTA